MEHRDRTLAPFCQRLPSHKCQQIAEEVRGQLRDTIAKELSDAVVAELCRVADVKTFNMDGK
jgi:hypothetical protein